ncbi:hypothetical protein [Actinoplanes sp. L3-i22]|uniref:hypothetical protein n=1 Tax=Actinoplanes sp. L3-i22 TaxID=2836373 RepID=UPI001C76FE19|nr:hypothetical protein [Actinoplanes sp. L3-i22]BCY12569.1 hypothetical protein L3i22_076570 [Actinoplanes sp. L3-i22]
MNAYRKLVAVAAVTLFLSAAAAAAVLSRVDRTAPAYVPVALPRTGFGARPEPWPSASGPAAELEFTHRDDLATLDLTGQYAAELAAAAGDHTDPASILAEHQRLRRALASDEHPVVLLRTTDLRHPASDPGTWLTVALGDFPSSAAVTAWCHSVPTAHCLPRRLDPPR